MKSQKEIFDELNKKWDDEKNSNKELKAIMIFNPMTEAVLKEHRKVMSFQLFEIYQLIDKIKKSMEKNKNE